MYLFNEEKVKQILVNLSQNYNFILPTSPILPKFSKEEIIDGLGNIAVKYNGDINITYKLIVLALRTHNQLYLIADDNTDKIKSIIDYTNNLLKQFDYSSNIVELLPIDTNTFFSMQKNFDCLLFIGSKKEYLSKLPHLQIKSIFIEYGEITVCLDKNLKDEYKKTLLKMDEFAFENDFQINYIDISDLESNKEYIDNCIKSINAFGNNQIVAIFTNTQATSYYFINSIHSSKIYLNSNPFSNSLIDFEESEFVYRKQLNLS